MLTDEEKKRRKERRLARKAKKAEKTEAIMKQPPIKADCMVCGKPIKPGEKYRKLIPDDKCPDTRYYHEDTCGPGTEIWHQFHPSRNSELMLIGKEKKQEKRILRREKRKLRRKAGDVKTAEVGNTTITPNQNEKEDSTMTKEVKKETPKKKGEGLKPMKPVEVPKDVVKKQTKDVQKLLAELYALTDRSSKEGAVLRKKLRKAGFKLSDYREKKEGEEKPAPKKETKAAPKEEKKAAPAPKKETTKKKAPVEDVKEEEEEETEEETE